MPDDIKVPAGVGDDTVAPPVATDLIGGRHFQKIKIGWGPDNTFNETEDASGKRLPVAEAAASTITNAGSGTADAQLVAAAAGLRLMGVSAKEDAATAAPAEFVLRHGTTTGGAAILFFTLGPDESIRDWFGPNGIAVASGVFLDRLSGTSDVTALTVVAP